MPQAKKQRGEPSSWTPPPVTARPPSRREARTSRLRRDEEAVRSRVFFQVIVGVSLLTAAFVPLLDGPRWLRLSAAILCGVAAMVSAWGLVVLRDPRRFTAPVATTIAVSLSVLGVAVIFYVGPFSAGAMVLTLGVYFFGTSRHESAAWTAYATVAALYFVASSGIAIGRLPELSLFETSGVSDFTRWFQVVMSQVIFGATFFLARSSRRATDAALDRVRQGAREIDRREALLAEARGELARAMQPSGGRYSGALVDTFSVGELIGRGAMGEVYRGRDRGGMPVAVKILHPDLVDNPKKVKRFLREAEAASTVNSPHVPRVYATGWLEDEKTPYLAMELLDGHDLGWHLRRAGRLSLDDTVEMVEQVARALADVREAGVVHRDLKPANIFLTDSLPRTWKVLDFGLSRLSGSTSSLTRGNAVGTPSYMSPEQVSGPVVDHRADLYALAAIAYRAICGVPPFAGNEISHVLFRVVHEQPASPASFASLPIDLELVLAIGMAKRRDERFEQVEELAQAMRAALRGELDDATRARGWAILGRAPWGSRSDAA